MYVEEGGWLWSEPGTNVGLEVCSSSTHDVPVNRADTSNMALPNLRRLFVESRTEAEDNEYSRNAFYNMVLFISSVAVFSMFAQRLGGGKPCQ